MNKSIVTGRLGKDPELKKTTTGKSVLSTQIAVNQYTKKDENEDQKVSWLDVVIWNQQADYVTQYAEKGDTLLVEGRLDKRDYTDKDGVKRYVTEIIAERVELFKKSAAKKDYDYGSNMANTSVKRQEVETEDLSEIEDLPF